MKTMRAALLGTLTMLMATTAWAQGPTPGTAGEISTMGGQSFGLGPRLGPQEATPLFMLGGLGVGIWARVPPPYNPAANRNGAANPLP